jgi:diguanylate cyclase (GGDEF)-like protein
VATRDKSVEEGAPSRLRDTPLPVRVLIAGSLGAAVLLPLLLVSHGEVRSAHRQVVTGAVLILLSVLNVEIGRFLEGGIGNSQRPHKGLSAWTFAAALVLPTPWLLPVAGLTYLHARWRGLRVATWKWAGSASYVVLSGLCAAVTARALRGTDPNWMDQDGGRGLFVVVAAASVFLLVETALFHGSAYLNHVEDEQWLRRTLSTPSFYLTEAAVLLVGGLSAAIWTGGAWFLVLLVPVYGLTQRAVLHEPLRERAELDGKTGLLRFESWRRLAVVAAQRCTARGEPWSVVFADLDHFKVFNDSYGHLAGDEALVAVADVLRGQLRSCDLVGRFGGEEFCVLLPGSSPAEATEVAERLRAAVAGMSVGATGRQVSVSLGVVTVEHQGTLGEFVHVLTEADRALYDAKLAGRDRVHSRLLITADAGAPVHP